MTDYRALCAELLDELSGYASANPHHDSDALVARARAALAEPVAEGPTDEELLALVPQGSESDFYLPQGLPSDWVDGDFIAPPGAVLAFARAVLARWGNHSADASKMVSPAPVPADGGVAKAPAVTEVIAWLRTEAEIDDGFELTQSAAYQRRAAELLERQVAPVVAGEVTELVEGLKLISDGMDALGHESDSWFVARAANLLEQRHPAPVPVSERLPGPEDCDAEGKVWGTAELGGWTRVHHSKISRWRAWLPATALPLPSGEV